MKQIAGIRRGILPAAIISALVVVGAVLIDYRETSLTCDVDPRRQAAFLHQVGLAPNAEVDLFSLEGRIRLTLTDAEEELGSILADRIILATKESRCTLLQLEKDGHDEAAAQRWAVASATRFATKLKNKGNRPLDERLTLPFAMIGKGCKLHFSKTYGFVSGRRMLLARCQISFDRRE